MSEYKKAIKDVSKLVSRGISMNDAIDIVDLLLGDIKTMVHFSKGEFQREVYAEIGYRLPKSYPLYENILSKR
tara:strand:+ start:8815 stop:9033 length:219 start_codon:yes stop_codon:yes gene_type:complete